MKKYWFVILIAFLFSCGKVYHVAEVKPRSYRIEKASYPVDTKVAAKIEPYKLRLDGIMNEVLSYNDEELTKGKPSSSLTNWFADVLLTETQKMVQDSLDFAIQNYGGIRISSLPPGEVTLMKVYEMMPFDNTMYVLELKGETVQQLFDKIAESEGWPISRNVYFEIAFGKAKNIKIKGTPLSLDKIYRVAIPDYVANGGDNMSFLRDCKVHDTHTLVRDMLVTHLRDLKAKGLHIIADKTPRIIN